MFNRVLTIFLFLTFGTIAVSLPVSAEEIKEIEAFRKNERVLILSPHPDDEAIACAGVIQRARKAGARVRVVYLTNGDHNEFSFIIYEKRLTFRQGEFVHMGEVRRQEAISAMQLLGVDENNLTFLGYPDFGTFAIFSQYWQIGKPFSSLLTRISSVPYKEDLSYGAPYLGQSILNDLKNILFTYKPDKVFVSHPADVNVDHKALYLFLQAALHDLGRQIPAPKVYPYLIHCLRWPRPRHYHPELGLEPPDNFNDYSIKWVKLSLTPAELVRKYRAILRYKSQTMISAFYLLSFARRDELFGDYPEIKLTASKDALKNGASERHRPGRRQGEASYSILGRNLVISVAKERELNRSLRLIFYLFGCSDRQPFACMPKIHIVTRYKRLRVYNRGKPIDADGIRLDLKQRELILRIPLDLLGDPDFILASVKAYAQRLPADVSGFRRITINKGR